MYPSLKNIGWIKQQAINQTIMDSAKNVIGLPRGTVRGEIVDVDDPKELGRVRVIFDAMSKKIPQVEGAGIFSDAREGEGGNISHWIDTCPAFKGKQPPGLVGKRVNIAISDGEYHYAILTDVIHDPQNLVASYGESLEIPNNSSMTRLPIYPAGKLPPPCKQNAGCTVIEEGGPMNSDWVCVCLKRDGKYIWVRHGDLAHGHAGGNDITSQVDSSGNRPGAGQVPAIWDHVFVTSHQEMAKWSSFGTFPRGNLLGGNAAWPPPPMGVDEDGKKIEPLPAKEAELYDQTAALSFIRQTGFPDGKISGAFTSGFEPQIKSAVESVPGYNFANKLLEKGQKVLKIAETAKKAIENPTQFVQEVALGVATDYVTAASKAAISNGSTPQGLITTVYSSLKNALGLS